MIEIHYMLINGIPPYQEFKTGIITDDEKAMDSVEYNNKISSFPRYGKKYQARVYYWAVRVFPSI